MNNISIEGYIDIHSHIIPNVDDGAKDIATSMDMLATAYREGIRVMVATPHYHPGKATAGYEEIYRQFAELEKLQKEYYPEMKLLLGREIYCNYDSITLLENENNKLWMVNSSYVLVEFSTAVDYQHMLNHLKRIMNRGYSPILAHVERYMCLVKDFSRVIELKDMGVTIQVNAGSVAGKSGWKIKQFVKSLLKYGAVDIIASDTHDNDTRAPLFEQAVKYISKKFGDRAVRKLFIDNPAEIIEEETKE